MWSTRLHLFSTRIACIRRFAKRGLHSPGGRGGGKNGSIKSTSSDSGGHGSWGGAIWAAYLGQLEKRPVITKMWTSGVINALGDTFAQNLFEKETPFNWKRLFVFTNLGLLLVGPTLHVWYGYLSRIFAAPGLPSAIGSLLLDQFAFAPVFCGVVLSTLVFVETQKTSSIQPKLQQDLVPTVIMNWRIWIPAQLVNFWIVPPHLRVLFANVVALIWTTYLSYASYKRVQSKI